MNNSQKDSAAVDAYIAKAPKEAQTTMKELRRIIKAACPVAKERISYGIVFFEYRSSGYPGRMIYFGVAKHHIGVYIVPKHLPPALQKQVEKYKKAKSTLHLPIGEKIPGTMIRQLVKIRMKEIDASLSKSQKHLVTKRVQKHSR